MIKNCSHCIAYNVDHCAARECQGTIATIRKRNQKLSDENIQKYYEFMISQFKNDFPNDANVETAKGERKNDEAARD